MQHPSLLFFALKQCRNTFDLALVDAALVDATVDAAVDAAVGAAVATAVDPAVD